MTSPLKRTAPPKAAARRFGELRSILAADLWVSCHLWEFQGRTRRCVYALERIVLIPHVRAVVMHRLAHAAWQRPASRPLAYLLRARVMRAAGADIHPGASIGPGFNLVHSVGVVIGKDVVAGRNLSVFQGVTIGDNGSEPGQPRLGDNVVLGAGAKILGPISIGDGATVGAAAVVFGSAPAQSLIVGIPGRVIDRGR